MDHIGVVGVGKLGICTALVLEKAGYTVHCNDRSNELLKAIETKTLTSVEPGVTEVLLQSKKLHIEYDMNTIYTLPVIFVVVATPSLPDGSYDHTAVEQVVEKLIELNEATPTTDFKVLVISCTTMPKYCDTVQERLAKYNYHVCYNPEFIAQGTIIHGFTHPDMVLIGHGNDEACDILKTVYKKFLKNDPPYHCMSRTEAELTKISLNCFLTTKIAFANSIGNIVKKAGGNPSTVLAAIGSDTRVGKKFLGWGYGFGGPCLPRDNRALNHFADTLNVKNVIGEVVDTCNKEHIQYLKSFVVEKNVDNLPYLFDSVVYKKNTLILEESQKLALAKLLAESGYSVTIVEQSCLHISIKDIIKAPITVLNEANMDTSMYFMVNNYIN